MRPAKPPPPKFRDMEPGQKVAGIIMMIVAVLCVGGCIVGCLGASIGWVKAGWSWL